VLQLAGTWSSWVGPVEILVVWCSVIVVVLTGAPG